MDSQVSPANNPQNRNNLTDKKQQAATSKRSDNFSSVFVYRKIYQAASGKPITISLSQAAWRGILDNLVLGDKADSPRWNEWCTKVKQHILKALQTNVKATSVTVTMGKNNWNAMLEILEAHCKSKGEAWFKWYKKLEFHMRKSY
jgi:hypothetical protein